MKKVFLTIFLLFLTTFAFADSPKLPATPFNFEEFNGLCRAAIVVTAGTPTVLVVGKLGNSASFTVSTLNNSTLTTTFDGVVDTLTASITNGNADITWCCARD